MKAITVWQPWASLIAIGAKPYEFRRWPAPARLVGQRIVIHAGARKVQPLEVWSIASNLVDDPSADGLGAANARQAMQLLSRAFEDTSILPRGCGLGTAILGTPRRCVDIAEELQADSDRIDEHVWAWPLSEFEAFHPPIPMRGAQGFWPWGTVS